MATNTSGSSHGAEGLKKPIQTRGTYTYSDKIVVFGSIPLLLLQVIWSSLLLGEDPRRHGGGQYNTFFLAKPSTYLVLNTGAKMPALGLGTLPAWYLPDYKPELAGQAVRAALKQGEELAKTFDNFAAL